jgi:hypothetical protein
MLLVCCCLGTEHWQYESRAYHVCYTSSHKLSIETGRFCNTGKKERLCTHCKMDIADEYHFVLACPLYSDLRSKFIKPYYYKKPSVFKLIQLFNADILKAMYNLGKYLSLATKLRHDVSC